MKAILTFLFVVLTLSTPGFAFGTESASCSLMRNAIANQSTLNVRVIFGYKDARPARFVGDRHERLTFIERITAACEPGQFACGFERSTSDADLFSKLIVIGQHPVEVNMMVVNSSVSTDDNENREDPFQIWKSQNAQRVFLNGFREADVVLYNGHSRFGGGPDFRPPELTDAGDVDPSYYKSSHSGIHRLTDALEETRVMKADRFSHLKILGLYSCSSSQHFKSVIRRNTEAGLIFSHQLMYYSDALNESLNALDELFANRCPDSLVFN